MPNKIINVKARTSKVDVNKIKTDLLVVGVFSDSNSRGKAVEGVDKALGGWIKKVIKTGDFKAEAGETTLLYGDGKIGAVRVLLTGLGKKKKADLDVLRKAVKSAASKALEIKAKNVCIAAGVELADKFDRDDIDKATVESAFLGAYKYDELITFDKDNKRPGSVEFIIAGGKASAVSAGSKIGKAQQWARTLANRPANLLYPGSLASEARKMAKSISNLSCSVMSEKQLKDKKFGGMIAIGQGSKNPPRLIHLKYSPGNVKAKTPVLGLVGKAITFDSGGISIKPSSGMHEMKMDMGGGAAMLGTIRAVAELKLPIKVHGIICSAENMPGSSSIRPGDVVTTYSKKTVEIQNTDAEGRMVMSDGIHFAKEHKCDIIIDAATLTGACVVALGKYYAGVMSNDDELSEQICEAGKVSGEKFWPLPCGDEYLEEMKSEVADLKNIGSRWGGACTAGAFLRQFAGEDVKWAHLDIAGPGMYDPSTKSGFGSQGFGVRALTEFVKNLTKK